MVKSQLKEQLPGGIYYQPDDPVISETTHCQCTNVLSERDFAQFDKKLTTKPTLSTIAACGLIMFSNNSTGEWLIHKDEVELKTLIENALKNKKYLKLKSTKKGKRK